jgi:hypothetical protein
LRSWLSDISNLLFVPVYSEFHGCEICCRLEPSPEHALSESYWHLLGYALGISVVRKVPLKKNLSVALAKLLLGDIQLDLGDLLYELPEEFHRLHSLAGKSRHDLVVSCSQSDEFLRHFGLSPKDRVLQLCQTMNSRSSPRSPRSFQRRSRPARFLGDQAEGSSAFAEVVLNENSGSDANGAQLPCIACADSSGDSAVKSPTVDAYVSLAVTKHFANLKHAFKFILPAFCQTVPEATRRNLTAAQLLDCWCGDAALTTAQKIDRFCAPLRDIISFVTRSF